MFRAENLDFLNRRLANSAVIGKTILVDGRPIASIGITLAGNEAAVWVFAGKQARRNPVYLFRTVQRELDRAIVDYRLIRVVAQALDDWRGARRFLECLGFKPGGCIENFMDTGLNYRVYEK